MYNSRENKGNDQLIKKVVIVKQILLNMQWEMPIEQYGEYAC